MAILRDTVHVCGLTHKILHCCCLYNFFPGISPVKILACPILTPMQSIHTWQNAPEKEDSNNWLPWHGLLSLVHSPRYNTGQAFAFRTIQSFVLQA